MTLSMKEKSIYLRALPQVGDVLETIKAENKDPVALKDAVREAIDSARRDILAAEDAASCERFSSLEEIHARIQSRINDQMTPNLRPVINATGVILHTNLGRSLLSQQAIERVASLTASYGNLEYDIEAGARGSRHDILSGLIRNITGAEDAMVVNNNASAVLLAISTLTEGGDVVVSRGELVEIGGSFRIPEIIELSGAHLREIGTTNKVHLADYERAAEREESEVLLKVHTSNFKIVGFTEEVELEALRRIADKHNLPLIYDLGSGLMDPLSEVGIHEPTVKEALAAGADLVLFSGDKLLGGPQAGIAIGKKKYIERMKRHPLARVVRMDKMSFAALEATFESYRNPQAAREEIPVLAMITKSLDTIRRDAEDLKDKLIDLGYDAVVDRNRSQVGGGSCPGEYLDTYVVGIASKNPTVSELERALRHYETPIISRIERDRLLLDPRTLQTGDGETILQAFKSVR
ncbi:MAG: L-seryl-tRNA(Sec) selenium transferase [Peptoniphilus sp.]|nr:L-seryl-tRNA(Sec) selenium transferase [Peptoniphilus sp.]MDY6045147.1 L-seryl-tRNA(Sec) selenium transferase [Peptoniphilus sp.]